jgi:hypothetical protein
MKLRIKRDRDSGSNWPGAMDFWLTTSDGKMHWLSVDSYSKLWWYAAALIKDSKHPTGVDYG